MKQTIGHLDSDCFYVSAERVRFPALRKIPVGVLGNQGACVIAKSYELKAAGVKTGMPIWDARKLCPDAVFVKRDFRWYEVLSRKMLHDLTDAERRTFLSAIPVGELCEVGRKSEQKLAAHGITNCRQFIEAKSSFIQKLLTIKGEALWWELQGECVNKIVTSRPPHKAISRGGSLGGKTADGSQQHAWVVRNVERLIESLDYHGVFARKLVLLLERPNDYGWAGQTVLAEPTNSFKLLCAVFRELLDRSDSRDKAISHMHLIAEKLTYRESLQLTLFETKYESHDGKPISDAPVDRLAELKQQINARIGRFAIRSGETLHLPDVYADETNDYDICDVQGKMCF